MIRKETRSKEFPWTSNRWVQTPNRCIVVPIIRGDQPYLLPSVPNREEQDLVSDDDFAISDRIRILEMIDALDYSGFCRIGRIWKDSQKFWKAVIPVVSTLQTPRHCDFGAPLEMYLTTTRWRWYLDDRVNPDTGTNKDAEYSGLLLRATDCCSEISDGLSLTGSR